MILYLLLVLGGVAEFSFGVLAFSILWSLFSGILLTIKAEEC